MPSYACTQVFHGPFFLLKMDVFSASLDIWWTNFPWTIFPSGRFYRGRFFLWTFLPNTSDTEACRRLRSGSTSTLFVPATRRSSLGDRAFPMAAARLWNTLPVSRRTVSSYLTFRRELKTFLFNISFPDN